MHTYTNPFHRVHYTASSPVIRTAVQPESYRGHQIFKINAKHYDVVKDGVLVAQRAGPQSWPASLMVGRPPSDPMESTGRSM